MLYFLLLLIIIYVAVMVLKPKTGPMPDSEYSSKEWIKAGGILGLAVLVARFARLPLVTVLTTLPFILPHLRSADTAQQKAGTTMTREEAALILGVVPDASVEAIRAAHRTLITKNHPDKGGNDYLAAKINQARDVLLG